MLKSLSGIDNLYDKSVLMFFSFITGNISYMKKERTLGKIIFQTVYGFTLFVFHWILWGYGVYGAFYFANRTSDIFGFFLFGIGCCMGLTNSVQFTKKYYQLYRGVKGE